MQTKHTQSASPVRDEITDNHGTAKEDTTISTDGASFAARLLKFAGNGKPSPAPLPTPSKPTPAHPNPHPAPTPQDVQVAAARAAPRNVQVLPESMKQHAPVIYPAWLRALESGQPVLTKRGGRRFLYRHFTKGAKPNAGDIDALLELFRVAAFKRGVIRTNPEYTGQAPYPRYVLP